MNDTFLSIENATGVAGWEIRVALCRFPPTARGARLTMNLWSIKKMTDASGNVCPLSPEVSVYSCLWMICPWWLFEAGREFIWLHMKSCHSPHCEPGQDTSQSVSRPLPTNRCGWEAVLEFITVHFCQWSLLFHRCLWPTSRHIYIVFMNHIYAGSLNAQLDLPIVKFFLLHKRFTTEEQNKKFIFKLRKCCNYSIFYKVYFKKYDMEHSTSESCVWGLVH